MCHLAKIFGNLCIFGSFPLTDCHFFKKLVFLPPMKHLCIIDKKHGFSICELKWQRPESGK